MSATDTTIYVHETGEVAVDSGDGLTFSLYGSDIQDSSDDYTDPAVYVDGVLQTSDYSINKTDGEITFTNSQSGAEVTCDYTWKIAAADMEDTTAYGFSAPLNLRVEDDVNGFVQIIESANRVQSFSGTLAWSYADTDMLKTALHLAETVGVKFEVHRSSLPEGSPYKEITNLVVVGAPSGDEIPGMPGRYNVTLRVREVNR